MANWLNARCKPIFNAQEFGKQGIISVNVGCFPHYGIPFPFERYRCFEWNLWNVVSIELTRLKTAIFRATSFTDIMSSLSVIRVKFYFIFISFLSNVALRTILGQFQTRWSFIGKTTDIEQQKDKNIELFINDSSRYALASGNCFSQYVLYTGILDRIIAQLFRRVTVGWEHVHYTK